MAVRAAMAFHRCLVWARGDGPLGTHPVQVADDGEKCLGLPCPAAAPHIPCCPQVIAACLPAAVLPRGESNAAIGGPRIREALKHLVLCWDGAKIILSSLEASSSREAQRAAVSTFPRNATPWQRSAVKLSFYLNKAAVSLKRLRELFMS